MKYAAVIGILIAAILSGCQAQTRTESIPKLPPAQTESGGERVLDTEPVEIGPVMSPALEEPVDTPQSDMFSLWGKEVGRDYQRYRKTGREDGPVYYLYVTDPAGNSVPNLNCYTRANWAAGLRGTEHLRGTSMESGLLPVVLSFREAEKDSAELILVNPNSGETLPAEINLSEVGWRYALHVTWYESVPAQTADNIEISVLDADGTPVSGTVVELPEIQVFRFSDLNGKVFFPADALQEGTMEFSIVVKDYLDHFQEGENWSETFLAEVSKSGQYVVMLEKAHK